MTARGEALLHLRSYAHIRLNHASPKANVPLPWGYTHTHNLTTLLPCSLHRLGELAIESRNYGMSGADVRHQIHDGMGIRANRDANECQSVRYHT